VSYNDKHNDANGEENKDGSSDNRSWNCGVEGPSTDVVINALRDRQRRNLLATLLLSQGTPMLLAGDESGRTQHGNNNAYCQDNAISWTCWDAQPQAVELTEFVRKLTGLRHLYPVLRRTRFLTGEYDEELQVRDLTWINANGSRMRDQDWADDRMLCFGMLLDGRARPTAVPQHGVEATLLLVLNAHHDLVLFTLPQHGDTSRWTLLVDTNLPELCAQPEFQAGQTYGATGRSLLLFILRS
jgi:isoamylase